MKNLVNAMFVATVLAAIAACAQGSHNQLTAPSTVVSSQAAASPSAGARTVNGSGEVTQMPGVVYRNTIDARLTEAGETSGSVTTHIIDLSGFGIADGKATLVGRITCLAFAEDTVWFGFVLTAASDKAYLDPGVGVGIGKIQKVGGQDYAFSGPAMFYVPPGTTCADRPALPMAPVRDGKFTIR